MKLTTEEKKELAQLSGYFKKLEITTNHLGIEMDEYIGEYRDNGYAQLASEESAPKITQRKDVFKKASGKGVDKAEKAKVKSVK
jgi:hypothetical protein